MESVISSDWISVKGNNRKSGFKTAGRIKEGRGAGGRIRNRGKEKNGKKSGHSHAHLDTPANPQLKVPQNLGDEASPAGSDAVQTGCLRKQVPHNGGGEGQVGVSEPVAAGDEGQSRAAEFGT